MEIICSTGYPCSGKSVVKKEAEKRGFPTVEMGDMVRKCAVRDLEKPLLEISSTELGEYATSIREKGKEQLFAEMAVENVEKDSTVFVSGLRSPEELEYFRKVADSTELIYIHCPFEIRYNRAVKRGREGEEEFSRDEFKDRDKREGEWGIDRIVDDELYTIKIENNSSLDDFRKKINKVFDTFDRSDNISDTKQEI